MRFKIIAAVCAAAILFVCTGCGSYSYRESEDGRMEYGVSDLKKDVFCIGPNWCGEEDMSFEVPDEFMGYPVTTLGGYTGRGYPCPFAVRVSAEKYGFSGDKGFSCSDGFFDFYHRSDDEYETLVFSVRLGKNVRTLEYVDGKSYLGYYLDLEDEEFDFTVKIVYSFTVDEENATFYAEDGKLYYKGSGELVDEFFYE